MRDPVGHLMTSLQAQGVVFKFSEGKIRWRAPAGVMTVEATRMLADNASVVSAFLVPDETLPDNLSIPASCPNTTEDIDACIDSKRPRRAA